MSFASTSIRSFTVLTEDDGVPGLKFEREPEYYTVDQLKRWLKQFGKNSGKASLISAPPTSPVHCLFFIDVLEDNTFI